jgi:hypothetical protein
MREAILSDLGIGLHVKPGALLVALTACLALLPAASAPADDRSLRDAGRSRDAQFQRLGDKTRRAYRAWDRAGHPDRLARRILRLNRRTRAELDLVRGALRGEQPSSAGGATYKRLMFRSLRAFDRSLSWDARAVRARMRDRIGAALRAARRARRHFDRSVRLTNRAIRAIEG